MRGFRTVRCCYERRAEIQARVLVASAVPAGQAGYAVQVDAGGLSRRWALAPLSHSPRRALDVGVSRVPGCLSGG